MSLPSFLIHFTNLKTSFDLVHSTFISSSASCLMAFAITFFVSFLAFLYLFLFSADLFVHHNLNAFFFRSIASFTCSFHHHVFFRSSLAFVFQHNSSQAFKTPFLQDPHKSFESMSTNFPIFSSNFSLISFSFSFHTLHLTLLLFFTDFFNFCSSTSTTTSMYCNSRWITFTSLRYFLYSFPTRTKSISVSFPPKLCRKSPFFYPFS